MVIKDFGGSILLIAAVGVIFYLVRSERTNSKRNSIISIVVWGASLFFIAANGPTGFYFIEFPLWYIFNPTYIRPALTLPLVCMAGYGFTNLSNWAGSIGDLKTLNNLTAKQVCQKILYLFIIASIFIESILLFTYMVGNEEQSAVTSSDYEAFLWIRNNTDVNATFFVSNSDAGQWILAIAHRRTFPIFKSHGESLWTEEYVTKVDELNHEMQQNPNSEEALSLLKIFNIDYVYIGKKAIYDRQLLNPTPFLGSQNYDLVYSDGDVWIFKIIRD